MRFLFLIAFCAIGISGSAQTSLGLEIGIPRSTLLFSSSSPEMPNAHRLKNGFSAGFKIEQFIGKTWSLESGLLFSQQGFVIDTDRFESNSFGSSAFRNHFRIMEIPMNLHLNYTDQNFRMFAGFGLSAVFLASAYDGRSFLDSFIDPNSGLRDKLQSTEYEHRDLRSNYIIGFSFLKRKRSFDIIMQHQRGHKDLISSSSLFETGHSRTWTISLGWSFSLQSID